MLDDSKETQPTTPDRSLARRTTPATKPITSTTALCWNTLACVLCLAILLLTLAYLPR